MHTTPKFLLALCILLHTILVDAKVVQHSLTITWENSSVVNGQPREMVFINGQMPGPNIFVDEDDDVVVKVTNKMAQNTSVHWHGLTQQGTPWADGTPGLTQKPIEPGETFIYRFKASPAGTYWYHSHSRASMMDGLYGGFYVRPKPGTPDPFFMIDPDMAEVNLMRKAAANPELVIVSDWSQYTIEQYLAAEEVSNLSIFCADSILINGMGKVICPGKDFLVAQSGIYTNFSVAPQTVNDKGCFPFINSTEGDYLAIGRPDLIPPRLQEGCVPSNGSHAIVTVDPDNVWVSLNFISAATVKTPIISIDEHEMWIYEVDGQYIEPQLVHTFNPAAGERYSAMIKLDKKRLNYLMRIADTGQTQIISTYGTLRYKGAPNTIESVVDNPFITYGGQPVSQNVIALDMMNLPPYPPLPPPQKSDVTHVLSMSRWGAAYKYTVSGSGMLPIDEWAYTPLLYNPNISATFDETVAIRTLNGSVVDIVMQVGTYHDEPIEFPHMMHKHSTKAWIIGADNGIWNYSSIEEGIAKAPQTFNLRNPRYRDTYITTANGPSWLAIRYQVTNPGPWLFHCHILLHEATGMALAILDGVDAWPEVPPEYAADQKGWFPGTGPSNITEDHRRHIRRS